MINGLNKTINGSRTEVETSTLRTPVAEYAKQRQMGDKLETNASNCHNRAICWSILVKRSRSCVINPRLRIAKILI